MSILSLNFNTSFLFFFLFFAVIGIVFKLFISLNLVVGHTDTQTIETLTLSFSFETLPVCPFVLFSCDNT